MAERKVINKYYPPDFDPAKIPKLKRSKGRQYVVRLMAPFNMRCKTCGEYIYKGRKFNARKETVPNELCMGLPIFRFYIKCTRCLAEITFKTDPTNTDYAIEHGATRNFQGEVSRIQQERDDEELNNPIKVLENRMKENKREMEVLENLQELKELNQRQAQVDYDGMIAMCSEKKWRKKQVKEENQWELRDVLELQRHKRKRNPDSDDEEESSSSSTQLQRSNTDKPTDIVTLGNPPEAQVLENRMKDTKREMEVLENLQELKELNQRQAQVDYKVIVAKYREMERRKKEREKEEDELELRDVLELQWRKRKRNPDSDDEEESSSSSTQLQRSNTDKPTDIVTLGNPPEAQGSSAPGVKRAKTESWEKND